MAASDSYMTLLSFVRSASIRSGNAASPAQNPDGAAGIRARIHTGAAARQLTQRRNHFRPHDHERIDDLIVGIAEFRLDRAAHA